MLLGHAQVHGPWDQGRPLHCFTEILGKPMEGLDALLSGIKRVLTPGSAEAPFAWLLAAALAAILVF